MSSPARSLPARALLLAALAASMSLAGCFGGDDEADPELARAVADTQPMTWAPGNWWAYRATYQENLTFDVALIVHESRADGFRLGSNVSAGFFGLPFTGNVSKSLNPRIGPEEWPLFQFPLHDGKEWSYTLFGYDAKTVAHAAYVEAPGLGRVPGFRLEATSYGQVFARYEYVADVGWFTRLELIEPTNGQRVLDVTLTAFGPDWSEAYYVERTIKEIRIEYPETPGSIAMSVPRELVHVRAFLTAQASAGIIDVELRDASGRSLAQARVVGKGVATERLSTKPGSSAQWVLEHKGAGAGVLHLEVTGLAASGKLSPMASQTGPREVGFAWTLAELLQSTRPERPQTGQTTSTGLPVEA